MLVKGLKGDNKQTKNKASINGIIQTVNTLWSKPSETCVENQYKYCWDLNSPVNCRCIKGNQSLT